jgi:hypothetical protein
VLTDVVGVVDYDNSLVVDALRRVETPIDIDDHLEAERQSAGSLFGEMPEQDEPTVVEARGDENLDQRMFGTTNYQDAVAHGVPYEPPESPTQEGIAGTDAGPASTARTTSTDGERPRRPALPPPATPPARALPDRGAPARRVGRVRRSAAPRRRPSHPQHRPRS